MPCLGAIGLPPRISNQGTHNEATVKVHVLACEPPKELSDHHPAVLLENGYSYAFLYRSYMYLCILHYLHLLLQIQIRFVWI